MESLQISDFNYFHRIEIRWNDLDPLWHVNNVMYMDYFQNARSAFFPHASASWDWQKHMFVVANIYCDFLKEMTLNYMDPKVGIRVREFGNKSFVLDYIIISNQADGQQVIHAKGYSTQVMIDLHKKCSITLPQWFVDEISAFQGS